MYEIHRQGSENNWWFKARKEIVHSIIDKYIQGTNNNILEVGAGYGIMTEILKEYGTVTAIEPYPDAARYLKNIFDIRVHCCNLGEYISFGSKEKYDIIAMFDVLEHIKADIDTIAKMYTILKNKGLLILTIPAYKFLWSKHDKLNNHYRRYTISELNKVFSWSWLYEKYPFTIRRITYFNTLLFPLALLDKLWLSKNKQSTALNPNKLVNTILYNIFKLEKYLLKYFNLPYGISILLITEKK